MDEAETRIREKLRKIEALFAQASTPGERGAAGAARERILKRLAEYAAEEREIEMKYLLPDEWSHTLFLALCRRYQLRPYRRHGQRRHTVMVRAPRAFLERMLWPEFNQCYDALREYLWEATMRVVSESISPDAGEAIEV